VRRRTYGIAGLLVACHPNDGAPSRNTGVGLLALDRDAIVFDPVSIGNDDPSYEQLWFENAGTDILSVHTPELSDGTHFFVSGSDVTLEPGARSSYEIAFDPRTPFGHEDTLVLVSDDPDAANQEVALLGQGTAPVLDVDVAQVDFGAVDLGCEAVDGVRFTNVGNERLRVVPSLSTSSELSLDSTDPFKLEPGASEVRQLMYRPLDDTSDSAVLTLESNDPFAPETTLDVLGAGRSTPQLDVFNLTTTLVDFVFVVDNSGSMTEEQGWLSASADAFVAELDDNSIDYRIGVLTTDQASFVGDAVTPLTIDRAATLANQVTLGTGGSGTERGLQMLYACAQVDGDCSASAGFLRDEAVFAGIIVSDEPDQSAGLPEFYVEYFWSLKSDASLVRIDAIAGLVPGPSACATGASPGYGYDQAVELSGGSFYDVCDASWDANLEAIARSAAADFGRLSLSEDPLADTLEVAVDGTVMAAGWSYTGHESDGGTNAVEFEPGSKPAAGSKVELRYTIAVVCE
jgi:hypothetical protein